MTKNKYDELLNECAKYGDDFKGYRVYSFIALPDKDLHVFTIFVENELMTVGLPIPRTFFAAEIKGHPSRQVEWDHWIAEQELHWKPIQNENLIMPGRFKRILGGQVEEEEEWQEGSTVDEPEIKPEQPKPKPTPSRRGKKDDPEMGM